MPEPSQQQIAHIALVVDDYDDAIDFYTQKLQFELIEDTQLSLEKRWVLVRPPNSTGSNLLLAKACNDRQHSAVGNQSGGRVFLFLETNDFWKDYKQMRAKGVLFNESPRSEPYGMVVVFQDLYGNKWDLLQLKR